ncbi:hypothetical protein E2320_001412 [Naja naja]|nr:hypothetical protein E2320_001412 [Naja naja]
MASVGVMGGDFLVSQLNETNYLSWNVKMEMYLQWEELWTIVTNPPAVLDDGDQRKNEKALASIILALEDSQLIHVRGLQSAKECWVALHSVYVRETVGSKVLLTRRLYKAQLKPGECMSTHLQNMRRTFLELEERGMTFTEANKVYVVLSSLDSSWNVLVTSLESMQEQDLTMTYLTEEEQKWLERRPGKGERIQHRPASTKVQDGGRAAETVNFVKRCYTCGSTEHLQRRCPEEEQSSSETKAQDYSTHVEQFSSIVFPGSVND